MGDYQVVLAVSAARDLERIVRFLAQKSPAAAERLGYALLDDALTLINLPGRGVAVRLRPGYRRIFHRPHFLIYYRIDEHRRIVEVTRIWDVRQNPAGLSLP